jgi:hypothetical protein
MYTKSDRVVFCNFSEKPKKWSKSVFKKPSKFRSDFSGPLSRVLRPFSHYSLLSHVFGIFWFGPENWWKNRYFSVFFRVFSSFKKILKKTTRSLFVHIFVIQIFLKNFTKISVIFGDFSVFYEICKGIEYWD